MGCAPAGKVASVKEAVWAESRGVGANKAQGASESATVRRRERRMATFISGGKWSEQ